MDIIEHHGVKGQKWGVRRKAKKAEAWEKKQQKKIDSGKYNNSRAVNSMFLEGYNKGSDRSYGIADKINSKWSKTKDGIPDQSSPKWESYYKEVTTAFKKADREEIAKLYANAPLKSSRYNSAKVYAVIDENLNTKFTIKH